jgi:hypothetical protein
MGRRRITPSPDQLARLVEDLRTLPSAPEGDHLTDEELAGYVLELLPPDDVARLDRHLASCFDCAAGAERLTTGAVAWSGVEGDRHLAAMRERHLGESAESTNVLQIPELARRRARAAAKTEAEFWHEGRWGALAWSSYEDGEGNLTLYFSSRELRAGTQVRLQMGDRWHKDFVLNDVPMGHGDEVEAEILLTAQEREAIPVGVAARFNFACDEASDQ